VGLAEYALLAKVDWIVRLLFGVFWIAFRPVALRPPGFFSFSGRPKRLIVHDLSELAPYRLGPMVPQIVTAMVNRNALRAHMHGCSAELPLFASTLAEGLRTMI
jgi:hypothetical protein